MCTQTSDLSSREPSVRLYCVLPYGKTYTEHESDLMADHLRSLLYDGVRPLVTRIVSSADGPTCDRAADVSRSRPSTGSSSEGGPFVHHSRQMWYPGIRGGPDSPPRLVSWWCEGCDPSNCCGCISWENDPMLGGDWTNHVG